MKRTNKLISILLAVFMLMQITTTAFAQTGLPTSHSWDSNTPGVVNFTVAPGVTECHYILYKDGERAMWGSIDTSDADGTSFKEDWRVRFVKKGAGTYSYEFVTYTDENEDEIATRITGQSYVYTPSASATKVATPQNPVFSNNSITFTQNTANVSSYTANFYIASGNQKYFLFENIYYGNSPSIPIWDWVYTYYQTKIQAQGLNANDCALIAEIAAVPENIVNYGLSDFSDYVTITGNYTGGTTVVSQGSCGDSATYKFTSDGTLTISGTGSVTDNSGYSQYQSDILKLVIEDGIEKIDDNMFYELYNLADVSIGNTVNSIGDGFLKGSSVSVVVLPESVLTVGEWFLTKCESLTNLYVYNPRCQIEFDPYAPISSNATIYGYLWTTLHQFAESNGNNFVSIDPDFTVNGEGEEPIQVTNPVITIILNNNALNNFTHYKILDEEYKDISNLTNGKITYTLDKTLENQGITIMFKKDSMEVEVYKSIVLDYKFNVTYMVNGEPFRVVPVGVGADIPEMADRPEVPGYHFEGWEEAPSVMPERDITVNAKMTKISRISGIVKSNGSPLLGADIIINGETKASSQNDGSFSFIMPAGEYMITVKSGEMEKSVAAKATSDVNLGDITLSKASSSAQITSSAVKLVEGIDSIFTEEDKSYAETPGNSIKVDVSISTAAPNANISSSITSEYSQYSAGIMLDIDINKIKSGAETSSTPVTETNSLLSVKFEIPQGFQGKDEYVVLREHNGAVDALKTTANENGEYIVVDGNYVTIYANRFSTYALIGRTVSYTPSGGGGSSKYTIKFDSNGGSKVVTKSITKNKFLTEPQAPTKEGFTFDGWYTDKELTTKYDFNTKVTKAFTLYAKWTENKETASAVNIVLTIGQKNVLVNGETIENDVAPKLVNERTMLPIRFIAERLGAVVGWEEETETVTVTFEDKEIIIIIGESTATVNGEKIELDSPAFIENARTYLPIRFLMENLGADIKWDGENQTVTIIK